MAKIARESDLDWMLWRPVLAKVVSLEELKTSYTLRDLWDLHEAMDIKQALEDEANKKAQSK
jgi:hypothetical protein